MRKFRAFHEDNNVMVYFDPEKRDRYVYDHFYRLIHSNVPNLMMQQIGIVDADGNDIYEGDLLDFDEREWGEPFQPEQVPLLSTFAAGDWPMCGSAGDVKQWRRVVGNVWQPTLKAG